MASTHGGRTCHDVGRVRGLGVGRDWKDQALEKQEEGGCAQALRGAGLLILPVGLS